MADIKVLHTNGQELIGKISNGNSSQFNFELKEPYIIVRHFFPTREGGINTIFSFVRISSFPFNLSDDKILRDATDQEEKGYEQQSTSDRIEDVGIVRP